MTARSSRITPFVSASIASRWASVSAVVLGVERDDVERARGR